MVYNWDTLLEAVNRIVGQPIDSIVTAAFANCVKAQTTAAYVCQVRRLYKWHLFWKANPPSRDVFEARNVINEPTEVDRLHSEELFLIAGRAITFENYCSFLSAHAGFVRIPFRTLRSALKHAQMIAGCKDPWAGGERAIHAEKSAIRTGEFIRAKRPKGTLSIEMIMKLFERAREANPKIFDAMVVQLGGCLRYGELVSIRRRHVLPNGLILTDTKRDRARGATGSGVAVSVKQFDEWLEGRTALRVLARLKREAPSDDSFLFPRESFTREAYNNVIKETAEAEDWQDSLFFDGSHVLRHAGVRRAVEALRADQVEVGRICSTLHMSLRTMLHYALSNEERVQKINIPRFFGSLSTFQDLPPGFFSIDPDDDDEGREPAVVKPKAASAARGRGEGARKLPKEPVKKGRGSRSKVTTAALEMAAARSGGTPPVGPSARQMRAERRGKEAEQRQHIRSLQSSRK